MVKKCLFVLPAVLLCACSTVNTEQNQRLDSLEEKVDALLVYNNKTYDIMVDNELRIGELEKDAKKRGVPVPQKLVTVDSLRTPAQNAENQRAQEKLPVQDAAALQNQAVGAITGQDLTKAEETVQANIAENITRPPSGAAPADGSSVAADTVPPAGSVSGQASELQAADKAPAQAAVSQQSAQPSSEKIKPAPQQQKQAALSSKDLYNRAYGLYQQRQYAAAEKVFDEFLQKFPHDVLSPNALYWKGETLYARAIYPQAIFAFKEVQTRYPKHPKTADSLLKTAMCYARLGDTENASLHYLVLLEDWPNSEAARKAKAMGAGN